LILLISCLNFYYLLRKIVGFSYWRLGEVTVTSHGREALGKALEQLRGLQPFEGLTEIIVS